MLTLLELQQKQEPQNNYVGWEGTRSKNSNKSNKQQWQNQIQLCLLKLQPLVCKCMIMFKFVNLVLSQHQTVCFVHKMYFCLYCIKQEGGIHSSSVQCNFISLRGKCSKRWVLSPLHHFSPTRKQFMCGENHITDLVFIHFHPCTRLFLKHENQEIHHECSSFSCFCSQCVELIGFLLAKGAGVSWWKSLERGTSVITKQQGPLIPIPMPNRQGAPLLLPTISKNIHFHLYPSKSYENSRQKTCHAADGFCIFVEKLMLTSCLWIWLCCIVLFSLDLMWVFINVLAAVFLFRDQFIQKKQTPARMQMHLALVVRYLNELLRGECIMEGRLSNVVED
jgi:hypothetical protein